MEIIVGTVEELLLGYKLIHENGIYTLDLSFTNHSHLGAVKAVAVSESGVLASGSSDECVRLFHLRKRVELGSLFYHKGSVNCLQFFESSHLFSGSDDARIGIWQTGSWERLKSLTGHKESVNCFSVHPTGKLGLSVSKDRTLFTWDLIHGRRGFVINLKQTADAVIWSPDGSLFVVVFANSVDIYSTETAKIVHQIATNMKISTAAFILPNILAVAGFGGFVKMFDLQSGNLKSELETNTNRVKSIVAVPGTENNKILLVTASSDGFIKVFELSFENNVIIHKLLTEVQSGFRPVCCTVFVPNSSSSPTEILVSELPDASLSQASELSAIPEAAKAKVKVTQSTGPEKKRKIKSLKESEKLHNEDEKCSEISKQRKLIKLKKKIKLERAKNRRHLQSSSTDENKFKAKETLKKNERKEKLEKIKKKSEAFNDSMNAKKKFKRKKGQGKASKKERK